MINWIRGLFRPSVANLQYGVNSAQLEAMAAMDALRSDLIEIENAIEYPHEESVNPIARNDLRNSCVRNLVANAGGDLRPILQEYGEKVVLLETARKRRRFSIATRQRVWERGGRSCVYCAEPIASWTGHDMHLDHVVPFAKGGADDESNLVAACPACNSEKSDDNYDDEIIDAVL